MRTRKTVIPSGAAVREELEALAHRYRHVENEVKSAPAESSMRRRLEDELLELRGRFDRVVDEWIADETLRESWRRYLKNREPEPPEPVAIEPVVFRGVSPTSGSVAEVKRRGNELAVEVDGTLVERIEGEKDFARTGEPITFRPDDMEFVETFTASDEALAALAEFRDDPTTPPPWDYAAELLGDGLINVHFDLTPRGLRALAR